MLHVSRLLRRNERLSVILSKSCLENRKANLKVDRELEETAIPRSNEILSTTRRLQQSSRRTKSWQSPLIMLMKYNQHSGFSRNVIRLRDTNGIVDAKQSTIVGYGFSQTFYQNLLFRVNVYNNYNLQLRWAHDKYK